jgi:hypothetical protein
MTQVPSGPLLHRALRACSREPLENTFCFCNDAMDLSSAPLGRRCPSCRSTDAHRSRRRWFERPLAPFGLLPFRCDECGTHDT